MIRASITTPPATLPVYLEQAKTHLAIPLSETDHDDLILALIGAATEVCEQITNRKFITQTIDLYLNDFPASNIIELPYGPLQNVGSIKYIDENLAEQTFPSAGYQVDGAGIVGLVMLKEDYDWPEVGDELLRGVTIRFTCGYGDVTLVPKAIKQAILLYVGTLYANRETVGMGSFNEIPDTVNLLLASYRIYGFQ